MGHQLVGVFVPAHGKSEVLEGGNQAQQLEGMARAEQVQAENRDEWNRGTMKVSWGVPWG